MTAGTIPEAIHTEMFAPISRMNKYKTRYWKTLSQATAAKAFTPPLLPARTIMLKIRLALNANSRDRPWATLRIIVARVKPETK